MCINDTEENKNMHTSIMNKACRKEKDEEQVYELKEY